MSIVKPVLITLLAASPLAGCQVAGSRAGGEAVGRYQLVQSKYAVGVTGQDTVLRIDTVTGKVWRYNVGPNKEGFFNRGYWTPVEDSEPLDSTATVR